MIAPRTTAGMDDGIMIVQTTLPGQMNEADLGQWCQVFIDLNLAACINITKVRSIFSWEKQVASEYEWKIQIKTTIKAKDSLVSKIKSTIHMTFQKSHGGMLRQLLDIWNG